ncbi:MAG: nitroreductase family protein [Ruminococcus sp.]|nr:nitroreductase family protein [Ruminococcus sp.]
METIDCIKTRRSVRQFTAREIPREVLEEIIRAAAFAPSWKNSRTPRWTVVTDKAMLSEIADKACLGFEHNSGIIKGCPCLVVQSAVKGRAGFEKDGSFSTDKGDSWEMYDGGITAQTLCLAAHDMGVGSVIMGIIDDKELEQMLNIPETERVLAAIAMGYYENVPQMPPKYDVGDIARFI